MSGPASWTHTEVGKGVHAAMTAALRADPHAIDAVLVEDGRLDPDSRRFVGQARGLVLACGTAMTRVLAVHRPGDDPYGREICRGCGTPDCRTLRGVDHVLAAYSVRPVVVDRAEAWRRADAWLRRRGRSVPLAVAEFPGGFVARPVESVTDEPGPLLVVDRYTGALSRWPRMPFEALVREYERSVSRAGLSGTSVSPRPRSR
ncbi:hypothetical protein [Actinomadura sp. NEAU-AAG7]|uniref:hypothetical protein n=1 Tax=Actinomadura sp. NEAU-AAG7 TaxID=2839640 RepID=UPI001BE4223C|nr:hypothetical protein [Actinomadura sp. NEAU-AAG7]MBT2211550.1 hypothetical protein [Actinomadura sp. NEAU-AAG7]